MTGSSLDRTGLNPVNVRPEVADVATQPLVALSACRSRVADSDSAGAGEEWLTGSRSKCTESR